jgi:hypothetical protein
MVLGHFSDICKPKGYEFHPIKNFRNCAVKWLRRFFANFCHEIGCENDQTYIFRFVKYLTAFFYIYTYLPVDIHFQLIIIYKCLDINWSRLFRSAILSLWYSRFEVTWLLRDHSKRKTRVRCVYVLPEVLHGDFLSEIKYLVNLEWNILQILIRNVIFFYFYSNWGELSFNIFKFFM